MAAGRGATAAWEASDVRWAARWCWTRHHHSRPWNQYAYFRRVVDLPSRPRRAPVRVSADARYTLFVNGRRVHYGPARSYPHFQSFDELDLAEHLQAGRNTICAIVLQFGVPTFQSVYRDISGFLLDGSIDCGDDDIPVSTPEAWLCRQAKGWRQDVARLTMQLGFQEHFDADADPADWMSPEFVASPDDGWKPPHVIGPVGCHPWLRMERRVVPLLAESLENFTALTAQFRGENARGYKIADDVYHLPLQESRKIDESLIEKPTAMLQPDGEVATIKPPGDGEFVMAVLDLREYRTGHLRLDIADAAGDEIIDILYTEDVEKSGAPALFGAKGPSHCEEATADRYRCRPGAQTWEAFQPKGMRYATLVFRNVTSADKPLKVRHVALRQVHAAFEGRGAFECSDPRLNRIWQVGRQTQLNCAFDAFVDCPWREQAQWWGDARVQAKVTMFAFGDTTLLERGIRLMAQSQDSDGSLHSHPPADFPGHRLPDFMLTWIGTLWDHHWYTGRTDLILECLPMMHSVLALFERHESSEGLVGDFNNGWWLFLDWQSLYKDNYSAVLNLMYLQALRWASVLSRLGRDETASARYAGKADRLQAAIDKSFWDDTEKLWRDGFDPATGKPVEQVSQHANALAILLELKPESHPQIANEALLKGARAKRGKILTGSPFFYAYILEALAKTGLRAEVLEVIRDKWGAMIDAGAVTFWEHWDGQASRCHAWSASPVYHLQQQVLGVSQTQPGWRRVSINPFTAGLEYARGSIPTPLGRLSVEWEKAEEDQLAVRVEVPHGMEAQFTGPLGETRTLEAGVSEFHT